MLEIISQREDVALTAAAAQSVHRARKDSLSHVKPLFLYEDRRKCLSTRLAYSASNEDFVPLLINVSSCSLWSKRCCRRRLVLVHCMIWMSSSP